MKPVVLDIQAFMPYASRQVIDFRDLGAQRLMMIAGETGAGKTAVLDAMAYGLFGASTGGGRTELSYRSHHASEGTLTYVNFQFELQGHAYRAVRYPPQPGKSQGVYELWRLSAIDDPAGALLASGKSKLNKAIQKLLGYSLSQFRSVVMLPQGQFREFLSAKTDKKAEILSSLFRTSRYQRLQDELYTRFKRLETQQADTRKQVEGILERAEVDDEAQLIETITHLKNEVSATERIVKGHAENTAKQLKLHEAAQALLDKFEQLDATLVTIAEMESQASQRSADEAKLSRARQAAQVSPVEKNVSDRQAERDSAKERLHRAGQALLTALEAEKLAVSALDRELALEPKREAIRKELLSMESIKAQVATLHTLVTARDALRETSSAERARQRECEQRREENTILVGELTEALASQRIAAAQLGSAKAEYSESADRLSRRNAIDGLKTQEERARQVEAQAEAQVTATQEASIVAKGEFDSQYQAHLSAYAAQLAEGLNDGAPCPVCGSQDHPAPAMPGEDAPDKDSVDEARGALLSAESAQADAHEALRSARAAAEPIRAELTVLLEQLGVDATIPKSDLEATMKERESALQAAQSAQRELPQIESELKAAQEAGVSLASAANEAMTRYELAEREHQAKQTLVKEKESSIPESLREPGALDARLSVQTAELQSMESSLASKREDAKKTGESCAETRKEEANSKASLELATEKHAEAEKTLFGRLADAGFADTADYRSAQLSSELCATLEQEVKAYDERLNQLRGQFKQLESQTNELARPDMEEITHALAETKALEAESRSSLAERQKVLSPKEQGLASIKRLKTESADREATFGVMASLARAAQGNNGYKLKFERYVLAGLLDEVLIHASRRLKKMSSGRYTLRRADPHRDKEKKVKIDRRSQAGLELEVVDAFTGRERDANTLSGGEGFQASLALALGLADVIQAQAGGIELSAMFIDEGFGTQSAEALDSVLDTLVGLQDSGRLVGFISHVDGMKDRISAKLMVHKTSTGSHANFVLT